MTLKEKFEATEVFIIKEVCDELLRQRIKIANDYAIEFAEWCFNIVLEKKHKGTYTVKELLEIYKKEKGL